MGDCLVSILRQWDASQQTEVEHFPLFCWRHRGRGRCECRICELRVNPYEKEGHWFRIHVEVPAFDLSKWGLRAMAVGFAHYLSKACQDHCRLHPWLLDGMETNSPPARMRPSVGEWLVTLGSPWFIVYPRLDCNIPGGSREEPSQIHNPKDFSSQVERYLTHNSYDSDMRSGQSSWLVVQWWVYLFSQEIYNIDVKHGNQPALCIPVLFLCETMKGTPFVPYCSYRFNIEHGESWFHPVWNDVNTHIASSDLPPFFPYIFSRCRNLKIHHPAPSRRQRQGLWPLWRSFSRWTGRRWRRAALRTARCSKVPIRNFEN